ncbi:MAG: hypothetical protein RBG1_1C00001G0203 [candidate division Zixibacteria bacterium RBG-1]|nr:MAG: hypothetical protein RBG1_1C00001G0203 [candidate division Zixibacteria bacterium RBG-1]OGC85526.1 MAG: hypothetical protein A2V73_09280 [candidate division Zixibacteria bacterium RBG_19FT_COMBO_42_43]
MKFTPEQLEKIREGYFFVTEFRDILERTTNLFVGTEVVAQYMTFLRDFNVAVPGVLNVFNPKEFEDKLSMDFSTLSRNYRVDGLLIRTLRDLAGLKAKLDGGEISPITPAKEFSFVRDTSLRKIVERDYGWLYKSLAVEAWKPVIILAGGLIEGLLLDKLSTDETKARSSSKAPKENDLKKWDLDNLIDAAVDLSYINIGVEKLSDAVRHYRNLVHPGNELRSGLKIEPEEARIAVEVLNMIIRELQNP